METRTVERNRVVALAVDPGAGGRAPSAGYGTKRQGIPDRLEAIGGSFEVRLGVGRGTSVIRDVPVQEVGT